MEIQIKIDRNYDTHRNCNTIPIRSTSVVQREDGAPWIHEYVVEKGEPNQLTGHAKYG